jgi:hypothetical protein
MKVITYIQNHPKETRLKETPDKLTVSIANIKSITQALATLRLMTA